MMEQTSKLLYIAIAIVLGYGIYQVSRKRQSAHQWYMEDYHIIWKPDGWDAGNPNMPYIWHHEPITKEEYEKRRFLCSFLITNNSFAKILTPDKISPW